MDHLADPSLDALLRDVPTPPDLVERLQAALAPTDDDLDAWVRGVLVPESFVARLHDIPDDQSLDESLTSVPQPLVLAISLRKPTLGQRLVRIARHIGRLSAAALLFVTIWTALVGGGGWMLASVFSPPTGQNPELIVLYDGPLSVAGELPPEAPEPFVLVVSLPGDATVQESVETSASDPAESTPSLSDASPGPVQQWTGLVRAGLQPLEDVLVLRHGRLSAPQSVTSERPGPKRSPGPRTAAVVPPDRQGIDHAFFLGERAFPPGSSAGNSEIPPLIVPLITGSDVLGRLERELATGKLAQASELRVEDFLAATNYRLAAAPAGRASLRTAAGAAPFGSAGADLLQVGVQVGAPLRRHNRTHLILALDVSHSMAEPGRLEIVRQALDGLLDQLGPDDTVSLVAFNEQVVQRVERATRADADPLRRLLLRLVPQGETDLAGGLQEAVSLAMRSSPGANEATRLVLVTGSPPGWPPKIDGNLCELLQAAGAEGVQLHVLNLQAPAEANSRWNEWTGRCGGQTTTIHSRRELYAALIETWSGAPALVARSTRLTLRFNRRAVAAYRLVGHEENALAELTPSAVETDLLAGEAATVLIELWLHPGEDDEVGHAELTWRDAGGERQQVRQRISRLQFAPTFTQAPLSLQQAALAAEGAQQLAGLRAGVREPGQRGAGSRGLLGVVALADDAHPRLKERPDFERMLRLLEAAAEVRRD